MTRLGANQLRKRTMLAAIALGAASIFLARWEHDDHWAAPNRHAVVIIQQLDDDSFLPLGDSDAQLGEVI